MGYELAPVVVTTEELEERLAPVLKRFFFQKGQLKALTGIAERRYWNPVHSMQEGAVRAGRKAMAQSNVPAEEVGMLVYGGVCRDNLEPATATAVAHGLSIGQDAQIYDVSNACLGALTGILQVANAIELGQIRAGLVVSCESSRQIVNSTIERILAEKSIEVFKKTIATLTGGSGACAILLTDGSFAEEGHRLRGGVVRNATRHHRLCLWGPDTGVPSSAPSIMETDAVAVLKHGVELAVETYAAFQREMALADSAPDRIICHQVGSSHQKAVLSALGIDGEKDFSTYQYLGNIGTVSLPLTAAIAHEQKFLNSGDFVGFFGIGSGLNCMMLGIEW